MMMKVITMRVMMMVVMAVIRILKIMIPIIMKKYNDSDTNNSKTITIIILILVILIFSRVIIITALTMAQILNGENYSLNTPTLALKPAPLLPNSNDGSPLLRHSSRLLLPGGHPTDQQLHRQFPAADHRRKQLVLLVSQPRGSRRRSNRRPLRQRHRPAGNHAGRVPVLLRVLDDHR